MEKWGRQNQPRKQCNSIVLHFGVSTFHTTNDTPKFSKRTKYKQTIKQKKQKKEDDSAAPQGLPNYY